MKLDYRFWIAFFGVIATIVANVTGLIALPDRVDKTEVKIEENEDNLSNLTEQISRYIAVQEAKEETEIEADKKLMKLIEIMVNK